MKPHLRVVGGVKHDFSSFDRNGLNWSPLSQPRWVGWRYETRGIDPKTGRPKVIKPPRSANGYASVTEPNTWGTRGEAEKWENGRIGFVLGCIDEQGEYICGIDTDGYLDENANPNEVARAIVDRFDSLTEASPSERGLHILFTLKAEDVRALNLRSQSIINEGDHKGVSLDIEKKYYTVTDNFFEGRRRIRRATREDVQWLLSLTPPEKKVKKPDDSRSAAAQSFIISYAGKETQEETEQRMANHKGKTGEWYREKIREGKRHEIDHSFENARAWLANQSRSDDGELEVISGEDIKLTRREWLWENCIPLGTTSLLAGDPDRGKSTVTFNIASRVTRGRRMPDGCTGIYGTVIIMSDEDDLGNTIGPRLIAAGADMSKIKVIKMVKRKDGRRMFSLIDDLPKLKELIEHIGDVRLIIIDPVNAYLGIGRIDTFRNSDVRSVLAPLRDLAEYYQLSVLMVTHTKKRREEGVNPIFHILDSVAFSAAPRAVIMIEPHPQDHRVRVFAVVKLNGVKQEDRALICFTFKSKNITDIGEHACIDWEDGDGVTLEDIFHRKSHPSPTRDAIKEFLIQNVTKEMPAEEVRELGERYGFNWRTMQRAAGDLGFQRGRIWAPKGTM